MQKRREKGCIVWKTFYLVRGKAVSVSKRTLEGNLESMTFKKLSFDQELEKGKLKRYNEYKNWKGLHRNEGPFGRVRGHGEEIIMRKRRGRISLLKPRGPLYKRNRFREN